MQPFFCKILKILPNPCNPTKFYAWHFVAIPSMYLCLLDLTRFRFGFDSRRDAPVYLYREREGKKCSQVEATFFKASQFHEAIWTSLCED